MNPVMTVHTQFREEHGKRINMGRGCWVWCPGCDQPHRITVVGEDGTRDEVVWDWDGNMEKPTFSPSILLTGSRAGSCHSFILQGRWQFLGDCSHSLAGQTVDMVPLPDWLVQSPDRY